MTNDTTSAAPSDAPCGSCGMPCTPTEYHPYAACLMFKACHNSETVRANLDDVRAHGAPQTVAREPLTPEQCNDLLAASFCIAAVGDPSATIKPEDAERIISLLHDLSGHAVHGIEKGGAHVY